MTNENKNVEEQNKNEIAEITEYPSMINETAEYKHFIIDGKHVRKAKFSDFSSVRPETREDQIWLLNLMEGDEESGNGLKEHVGKIISVSDVITVPYDKMNEDTGLLEDGVLTYLITPEKVAYITSSKTVYFSINRIMKWFGTPDTWEKPIQVKVGKEKRENGDMIKIKMVG